MLAKAKDLYMLYHPYWWCRRQHYLRLKKEKMLWNMLSLLLAAMGVIVGPIVTNALVVSGLTVAATMVKGFLDYKRYDTLVDMSRYAYTMYAKVLKQLKTMKEQEEWDTFEVKMDALHETLIDLTPILPDHYKERYKNNKDLIDFIDSGSTTNLVRV